MVDVAQLVRASVCGTEGRRFEPDLPPLKCRGDGHLSVSFFYKLPTSYFIELVKV